MTPEELGRWAVLNQLPPHESARATGIAARVAAIVRAERERALKPTDPEDVCSYCNGTGEIAVSVTTLRYVAPGPVPEDARGVAANSCFYCLTK